MCTTGKNALHSSCLMKSQFGKDLVHTGTDYGFDVPCALAF